MSLDSAAVVAAVLAIAIAFAVVSLESAAIVAGVVGIAMAVFLAFRSLRPRKGPAARSDRAARPSSPRRDGRDVIVPDYSDDAVGGGGELEEEPDIVGARSPGLPDWESPEFPEAAAYPAEKRPDSRFANVSVLSAGADEHVAQIGVGESNILRVGIGVLDPNSLVEHPVPVPDERFPHEDISLEVLLSSADFGVSDFDQVGEKPEDVATKELLLPADGGAAVATDGRHYVDFRIKAPSQEGPARARLSYLYRNTIVQSQRLDAIVGSDALTVTTDFTLSARLGADLAAISARPRVTLLANHSNRGDHQIVVRGGDAKGTVVGKPVTFTISDAQLGPPVQRLRDQLASLSPKERQRPKNFLIDDLQKLAPLGRKLYEVIPAAVQDLVRDVAGGMDEAVLQIALSDGSTFTVPWSYVYDIYLPSATPPTRLPICPVVEDWNGKDEMVDPDARVCPRIHDHIEGVLCPFGFWGFRYSVEVLTSAEQPRKAIQFSSGASVVVGETTKGVQRDKVAEHIAGLSATLAAAAPGTDVKEASTAAALRTLIEADLPILYFLCHGEHKEDTTCLALGQNDAITPGDLMGWIDAAAERDRRMWTNPQPFVFINACESLAITPQDLANYLGVFVNKAGAVGLVGTEVKVEQGQAMLLAESFFERLLRPEGTVDSALRHVRGDFLGHGNLFGLAYTPYCFADLAVRN